MSMGIVPILSASCSHGPFWSFVFLVLLRNDIDSSKAVEDWEGRHSYDLRPQKNEQSYAPCVSAVATRIFVKRGSLAMSADQIRSSTSQLRVIRRVKCVQDIKNRGV